MLTSILTAVHLIAAISIVVLVLLQQGKGADMGAAFGGGSSQSLFGSRGSANFLSRTTAALAIVFFLTGLTLAYIYAGESGFESATQAVEAPEASDAPVGAGVPDVPADGAGSAGADGDVPAVPESGDETSQ
ncbi:MAG: preprotein translocase subunit SecG [Gammaproteobacteria bacterium]|nr:preprotein translocase subunit SecG [Gammaproteobacteria bacterium]